MVEQVAESVTHPVSPTIGALLSVIRAAVPDADVLDFFPEEYAKSLAIVIGDVETDVSRDRFASRTRLPFAEEATISVQIGPSPSVYSKSESRGIILDTIDKIITAITSDVRLGGVDGLVRCVPFQWGTTFDEESTLLGGTVQLSCEYRIDREVTP